MSSGICRPAVFLDRDGTINVEVNYLSDPDEFRLLPGVAEAIHRLNREGWPVVVVTNQSGIGRSYFTQETLASIHQRMNEELAKANAHVDAIFICPHHPSDNCNCRKPKVGLFQKAAQELGLDVRRSVIIGDKVSDLLPARELGCRTVLVLTGYGESQRRQLGNYYPDAFASDLAEAVSWWLKTLSKSS
ncbi:MAG: D-glycero-beta-D-manno-heptose 1,7-bisphosphate 7-phosphatase [Caldilineaceae bacterium]|nr:D-glycero-beta-D-manno-heptose 1,7-bisphosphate 7-phosphatase [Caldilineaceae bacterium]